MVMNIDTLDTRVLSDADAQAIGELLATVWPKPGKTAAVRARQMLELGQDYHGSDEQAPRSFVIREAGKVIAHSAILPRTIGTSTGELTIAGLARVCIDPQQRGHGLGEMITRAALKPIDDEQFLFALFQTSPEVRPFYEKLGCCAIENKIVNSLGDDMQASPFWDRVVMIYPNDRKWPDGEIDLRGPGY